MMQHASLESDFRILIHLHLLTVKDD